MVCGDLGIFSWAAGLWDGLGWPDGLSKEEPAET